MLSVKLGRLATRLIVLCAEGEFAVELLDLIGRNENQGLVSSSKRLRRLKRSLNYLDNIERSEKGNPSHNSQAEQTSGIKTEGGAGDLDDKGATGFGEEVDDYRRANSDGSEEGLEYEV